MKGLTTNRLYIDTYLNGIHTLTDPICLNYKAVLFVVGGETPAPI
jgi:hypothetical protein